MLPLLLFLSHDGGLRHCHVTSQDLQRTCLLAPSLPPSLHSTPPLPMCVAPPSFHPFPSRGCMLLYSIPKPHTHQHWFCCSCLMNGCCIFQLSLSFIPTSDYHIHSVCRSAIISWLYEADFISCGQIGDG